jgi:predicted aspartyl protease
MRAARIRADRKIDVAAGYLRKTALQEYKRLRERNDEELSWEEFKYVLLKRFDYTESTESVVTRLCKIKQDGNLEEYINSFTYTLSRGKVSEDVAVGLFTNGLIAELASELQYRRPKSLNETIHIVNDYARIKLGMKYGQSKQASANYVSNRSNNCYECGKPGHYARDCWARNNWQRQDRRTSSYNETYSERDESPCSDDDTSILEQINEQLKQIAEQCDGSFGKPHIERKAYKTRQEPQKWRNQVAFDERQSSTERSSQEHDSEHEVPQERPIRKAKRKHEDKMQFALSDEEPSWRSTRASYLYAANNCAVKKSPLFKVKALFNGLETEAILDTGAAVTLISEELLEALDINVDSSNPTEILMANSSKVTAVGITEPITVEVSDSKAVISALVMPMKHSQILLGMDWFHASGASICPKDRSLQFVKAKPRCSAANVAELRDTEQGIVKQTADHEYLQRIVSERVEVYSAATSDKAFLTEQSELKRKQESIASKDIKVRHVQQINEKKQLKFTVRQMQQPKKRPIADKKATRQIEQQVDTNAEVKAANPEVKAIGESLHLIRKILKKRQFTPKRTRFKEKQNVSTRNSSTQTKSKTRKANEFCSKFFYFANFAVCIAQR